VEGVEITDETVADYLRFYCFALRGERGPLLRLVEEVDGAFTPTDPGKLAEVRATVWPIEAQERDEGGRYVLDVTATYGSDMFLVRFAVRADGRTELMNERHLLADLPNELFPAFPELHPRDRIIDWIREHSPSSPSEGGAPRREGTHENSVKHFGFLVHQPGVDASRIDAIRLGAVTLSGIDFASWLKYEGLQAHSWQSYFGEGLQTFFGAFLPVPQHTAASDPADVFSMANYFSEVVWRSITLTYRTFVPHPALSLRYAVYRYRNGELITTKQPGFGDFDLLRHPRCVVVEPGDAEALEHNHRLLSLDGSLVLANMAARLQTAFSACVAREPDAWHYLEFVCELEYLLNPDGEDPLQRTFADRLARMCADDKTGDEAWREVGTLLYRYRSRTLHGHDPAAVVRGIERTGMDLYPFPFLILEKACLFLTAVAAQIEGERDLERVQRVIVRSLEDNHAASLPRTDSLALRQINARGRGAPRSEGELSPDITYSLSFPPSLARQIDPERVKEALRNDHER
jgi:hypothetical protein